MCGISGIAYTRKSGLRVDRQLLIRMRDRLAHRGPDGAGVHIDQNVGLAHRRLSIVDLATGDQPMFNEDRSCVIVYNGEVYDHADRRAELERRGYAYRSTSDTETILHLYEEFGSECVRQLRGMFAFAIWDSRIQRLFLSRDRFGVKPLYYVHDPAGNLFFASEIKALLEVDCVKPELNYATLPDQLANHGISDDQTLFKGIRQLLPGHSLTWDDGQIEIHRYWNLSFEPKNVMDESAAVEEWYGLFREAVRLRLMSDVPVGMFLSGGIDSSAIAAVMSDIAGGPIKTFSVGFAERSANEFEYAREVSRRFGTEHHEVTVSPADFFSSLPKLVWHEDKPLGFEASVPLYFVSKLANEHVKVVLTGEGSDETLAGYGRYRKAIALLGFGERYEAFTPSLIRDAVRSGVTALPSTISKKLTRTFLARDADLEGLYFDNFAIFGKGFQNELLTPQAAERIGTSEPYTGLHDWLLETDGWSTLDRILYVDIKSYLLELLVKQDRMSMAASIESRVPFLDHKLVEFTSKLPDRMRLRGRDTKWILRRAMRGVLPDSILDRPKMGFPVPLGDWLRGRFRYMVDDLVLSERSLSRGLFRANTVRRLVEEHYGGEDHASRIFRLMNLELWHRVFIDGEAVPDLI